jgi:hypothetical protein
LCSSGVFASEPSSKQQQLTKVKKHKPNLSFLQHIHLFTPHQNISSFIYFLHKKYHMFSIHPKENRYSNIIHPAVLGQLLLLVYHQEA